MTFPNRSSKYGNHQTSDDTVKHSTIYEYSVMLENSIRLSEMIVYLGSGWLALLFIWPTSLLCWTSLPQCKWRNRQSSQLHQA